MRILFVGDMHFRLTWPHAELFADRRVEERKMMEEAVLDAAKDSDGVVLLGDVLDAKENHPNVLRDLAVFLNMLVESCPTVAILGGNHDGYQDGTSALDVYRETMVSDVEFVVSEPKTVIWNEVVMHLIPFMHRQRTGSADNAEAAGRLVDGIPLGTRIVAAHHAFSGTKGYFGVSVDDFPEIVLPAGDCLAKAKHLVGGHIHVPSDNGNVHVVGSLMNHAFGEDVTHRLMRYDSETDSFEVIPIPGRVFPKVINPSEDTLKSLKDIHGAVKVVLTEGGSLPEWFLPEAKVVDTIPETVSDEQGNSEDLSLTNLLKAYAEAKGIDYGILERGMNLAGI